MGVKLFIMHTAKSCIKQRQHSICCLWNLCRLIQEQQLPNFFYWHYVPLHSAGGQCRLLHHTQSNKVVYSQVLHVGFSLLTSVAHPFFFYALHPDNINKETMTILGIAHIFAEKKSLSTLKSWFYHPEAIALPAQKKKDDSIHEPPMEMGFIYKSIGYVSTY